MMPQINQDGFSLVEVLVALVVASLIVSATTTLSWTLTKLNSRAQVDRASRENILAADRVFKALVLSATATGRVPNAHFSGTPSRMSLLGRGLATMAIDDPRPMTLESYRDEKGWGLKLTWQASAA